MIREQLPLLDDLLEPWQDTIGSGFEAYRNHVYRVLNFCFALHDCHADDEDKLIIAGCFHDLGIWTHHTFDYLEPSIEVAHNYLAESKRSDWADEIGAMIDLHHRFRRVNHSAGPLVEVFRQGDWVDASLGCRRFGLAGSLIRDVQQTFPNCGFHRNVLRLALKRMRTHPLSPFPMMKW